MGKNAEKAMAIHSSTLAWNIPWKEEPGRLQSMGSLRVVGGSLGLGLAAMGTARQDVYDLLKTNLYQDDAVTGK